MKNNQKFHRTQNMLLALAALLLVTSAITAFAIIAPMVFKATAVASSTPVATQTIPPTQTPTPDVTPLVITTESATNLAEGWQLHPISSKPGGPDGVRMIDVNQDGWLDVITAFESSGDVMIFQHPGLGGLHLEWPSVRVADVPRGEDAVGADLDSDGFIDVISSHEGDTLGIYVHWAPDSVEQYMQADSWQTREIPASHGKGWMFAVPMDVNQDGNLDIVAGSKDDYFNERNSVGDLGWFESPAEDKRDLDNWSYHSIDHVGWTMSIIPFDVDADGYLDLLLTDRDADVEHMGARWLKNPGANWEEPWTSYFLEDLAGTSPAFMTTGDLDGDGIDEFLIPIINQKKIVILQKTGNHPVDFSTTEIVFNDVPIGSPKGVGVTDIDLDGNPDIVLSFEGGKFGVLWLSRNGDPFEEGWSAHVVSPLAGGKFDLIQFYDVDRDGDQDILTTEEVHNLGVVWFENPTIDTAP